MLEIYLIFLSVFLVCLSVKFFFEIHYHKKYVKNLSGIIQNFFFVFCIIFLINLLSISIIKNISQDINVDIVNLASTVENHDINHIAKK